LVEATIEKVTITIIIDLQNFKKFSSKSKFINFNFKYHLKNMHFEPFLDLALENKKRQNVII
jgi:hypothetical protein